MTDKKRAETPDEEIFAKPEPKDPWAAKPLTLDGTARIIQLVGGILGEASQKAAVEQLLSADEDHPPIAVWQTVIGSLDKAKLAEFLSIITRKSPAWVTKNYSLLKASKAIGQFLAQEDFQEILKNLRPAVRGLNLEAGAGSPES